MPALGFTRPEFSFTILLHSDTKTRPPGRTRRSLTPDSGACSVTPTAPPVPSWTAPHDRHRRLGHRAPLASRSWRASPRRAGLWLPVFTRVDTIMTNIALD